MRRPLLLMLTIAAAGLMGRGMSVDVRAEQDVALQEAVSVEQIASVMGATNPNLSVGERERIGQAVLRSSRVHGLDPQLVTAIILVESGARPWALSPKGAVGLMQVMPHVADGLPLAGNLTTIERNIEAGCWILADNIRRLGEDDGISAYFWGSDIRGVAYLDRVREARASVRRDIES